MLTLLWLLGSIALYAAAFAPWNLTSGIWVALIPLLLLVRRRTPWRAALVGLLWGIGSNFAVGYWVASAIATYYEQPLWFGIAFCVVTSLIFWAPYYAAFAMAIAWARPRCRATTWVVLVAALWVAAEYGRANLLTGAPWLMLGYAVGPYVVLRQAADLGGVYLLSFVVVLVNAALTPLVEMLLDGAYQGTSSRGRQAVGLARPRVRKPLLQALRRAATEASMTAGVVVAVYAYGTWRLAVPIATEPAVPVAIIQGNNQDAAYWLPGAYAKGLEQYLQLSAEVAQATHPRLLIWPEAAVTMFFAREEPSRARISSLLEAHNTELLLGAPHVAGDDPVLPRFLNSAFAVSAQGEIRGRYDKRHLMPFVEYFPLRSIELLRRQFERVRSFTPGGDALLLATPLGRTAVAICFEAIFPDLVRRTMNLGADVLVNLSNDVWLGPGAGAEQHVSMIRFRAIENRTWVIRATTTGVSAIIDPFGHHRAESATFEAATLTASVVPLQVMTLYERVGDLFAHACTVIASLTLLCLCSRRCTAAPGADREPDPRLS